MSEYKSVSEPEQSPRQAAPHLKSWAIKWTDAAGASGLGTSRWADHPQAWNAACDLAAGFPGLQYQVVPSSREPNWRDGLTVDALGSLRPETGKASSKFAHGMPVYALRVRRPDGQSGLGAAWSTRERAMKCMDDLQRAHPNYGFAIELHVGELTSDQDLVPGMCRVIQEMPQPESGPGLALAEPGAGSATYAWPPPGHNPSRYAPEAQKSIDPLDVKYDGIELRTLLLAAEGAQRELVTPLARSMTKVQRTAVSAHWSMQLRAKVHAAKEKERTQVVADDVWGDDD